MCHDASVKLVYLPLYSPDVNPIEEFYVELKAFTVCEAEVLFVTMK
jgi:transposase